MKETAMRKRILITGANGFVGHSLADWFVDHDYEVVGLMRNNLDEKASFSIVVLNYKPGCLRQCIENFQPHYVIHAAGTASVGFSVENPAEDFKNSAIFTHYVMEEIRRTSIKPRVIFTSSAAVYGNSDGFPISENQPIHPISPYGFHKAICERIIQEYAECYAIPGVVVRLFSVFGWRQRRLLVGELFKQIQGGGCIQLQGSGDETRDYLSIDHVALLMEKLMESTTRNYETYNLASGDPTSVRTLVGVMQRVLKSTSEIYFSGKNRPGDPLYWQADMTKFRELIGFFPTFDLEKNIEELVKRWQKAGY